MNHILKIGEGRIFNLVLESISKLFYYYHFNKELIEETIYKKVFFVDYDFL